MLTKIVSGAQSGADLAGLEWAKAQGLATGGAMPKGYRTEDGAHPEYAEQFGMIETEADTYPPRTRMNVMASNATVIFGNPNSNGCRLTIKCCQQAGRPYLVIVWPAAVTNERIEALANFMTIHTVLNVAGNRESKNPGIGNAVKQLMSAAWERAKASAP